MANHRIDESNSEYSASFLSEGGRLPRGMSGKTERYNPKTSEKKPTVMEEDEESE